MTTRRGFLQGVVATVAAVGGGLAVRAKALPAQPEVAIEGGGFGLAQVKAEGAAIQYDSKYEHQQYGLGFKITVSDEARALARGIRETSERRAAEVLNRFFS